MNRLDDIIIFDVLNENAIANITQIQVDLVKERLAQKEITLEVTPAAIEFLAKEGYNPQYGARPLRRLIQSKILNQVASLIISKGIARGGIVVVDVKNNEFVFDVKKGRKGSLIEESLLPTESVIK